MPKFEVDIEQIRRLVKLVERHGLAELSFEEGEMSVIIKGHVPSAAVVQQAPATQPAEQPAPVEAAAPLEEPAPEPEAEGEVVEITAPLVGVFYRSPAPDAPPSIETGEHIEVGQEIGLIEAMKVFSPIPSEVAGTVIAIPAQAGKLVQQGETLVLVRPDREE